MKDYSVTMYKVKKMAKGKIVLIKFR
jgi:hypothetical protein